MLPKAKRLRTEDFKDMRKARVAHAQHFFVRVSDAPQGGLPAKAGKAAVVVSSSVYKKATERNLLRRRVYHLLRAHPELILGRLCTVTLKKGALGVPFKELEHELVESLKKS